MKTQKTKDECKLHDRWTKDGQEQGARHNIGWIKDKRQQQTKLKPHQREKNINNKLHNKH
jgi:hypothetical protein